MEDASSRQDCHKPSPAVTKKPSSSLRDQITAQVLKYVLFGRNPVQIVNVYETHNKNRIDSSGEDEEPEISTARTEKDGTVVTKATENRQSEKANSQMSYALASFPDEVTLCISSIPGTRYGVCAKQYVPVGTWIGPYEGKRITLGDFTADTNTSHMWEIYGDGKLDHFIDGSDQSTSSWMRFIRCARHKQEQNLFAFQHNKSIFYRAFRDIPRGCELLVWYEDSYIQHMGIPVGIGNKSSVHYLPDKRSSVKHTVPVRATSSSGEHGIRVDADRGSGPSRGQKRRSSTQTLYSLLRHEASDESTTQRHIKRFRIQQEIANNNNNNNSLASKEAALRLPRAGADHNKKATTSEHEGAHHRRVFDEVLNTIGDGGEFNCGQCMTTFTQRSLLNNHLCSRMPCKPYRCGHCQEAFAQPKELRMHAVVHVSEKPFKCGYCLRAFSGATTLNNHVRTHTGEKPFLCEGCGKSFSQAFQLSRHRRICLQHAD